MDQGPSVRWGGYSHRDQSFYSDSADGLKPIRTVGVHSHRDKPFNLDSPDGPRPIRTVRFHFHRDQSFYSDSADGPRPIRTVGGSLPPRPVLLFRLSGWTKAHPYDGVVRTEGFTPSALSDRVMPQTGMARQVLTTPCSRRSPDRTRPLTVRSPAS